MGHYSTMSDGSDGAAGRPRIVHFHKGVEVWWAIRYTLDMEIDVVYLGCLALASRSSPDHSSGGTW